MFQNIKVDIIYYNTNTDFELEFNLCGCCRMRLLTSKSSDKKTFVHDLARAVSRSRVILIAGKLFGEDGIMQITANSISKTLTEIDTKRYGISSDNDVKIINGATPLVTPDGQLGGCIIESGPQSMILLSDNKAIRKTVMNNLIHPYIADLCGTELKATASAVADNVVFTPEVSTVTEPDEPQEEPIPEVTEEIAEEYTEEEAIEETEDTEQENEVVLSGNMEFETEEETQSASDVDTAKEDTESYDISSSNEPYYFEDDETDNKHSFLSGNLSILILSITLLIILAILCYCIFYVPTRDGTTATAYLNEAFSALFG